MADAAARSSAGQLPQRRMDEPPGIRVLDASMPLKPGREALVRIATLPGAECQIAVYQGQVRQEASGLATATADADGNVEWTWGAGNGLSASSEASGVVICSADGQTFSKSVAFAAGPD